MLGLAAVADDVVAVSVDLGDVARPQNDPIGGELILGFGGTSAGRSSPAGRRCRPRRFTPRPTSVGSPRSRSEMMVPGSGTPIDPGFTGPSSGLQVTTGEVSDSP